MTRREILDATADLLSTEPFRALSVGEVMRRTGVGRSAFYAHFADVYAVVEVLLADVRDEEVGHLEQWDLGASDPAEGLRRVVAGTVDLWARSGPMLASMLDAAAGDPRVAALFDDLTGRFCEVVAGAIRRDDRTTLPVEVDVDEVARLVIVGTQAYLRDRLGRPDQADRVVVERTLETMWTSAIYGPLPTRRAE